MNICIIGGTGRLGGFFGDLFEKEGHEVSRVGRKNYSNLKNLVSKAGIIIVSIPPDRVGKVLKDISPMVKKNHLVIDFSSVMSPNEKSMKSMKCGSAFIHPLFAPSIKKLNKMRFIVVPVNKNRNLSWMLSFLKSKGAVVKTSTLKLHEKLMAHVQALAHFNGILLAKTLAESDLSIEDIEEFSTVFFRLEFDTISRIFSQSPEMYANIQFHNPEFVKLLDSYKEDVEELKQIVVKKDHDAYEKVFKKIVERLGNSMNKSFRESQELVDVLSAGKTKVGLLGPSGSFSEIAADAFDSSAKKIFFQSMPNVIKAVADGIIDFGVVPVENSIGGTVAEVIDAIFEKKLSIEKTIVVPISHCCAALSKDVNPEIVLSHLQALLQCSDFLEKDYPDAKQIKTLSTSEAFKKIAGDYMMNAVAIGTKLAAKIYNLKVIKEGIENNKKNKTKFAVVTRESRVDPKGKITSIVISPKTDRPGLLFDMLKHFKESKINLSKIESRPSKQKLGAYVFHLDLDANVNDTKVKKALEQIKKEHNVTFLGCYKQINVK